MSGLCHAVLLAVLTAASAQRGVAGPPGGGRRRPGRPGSASGAVRGGAPDAKMRRPPVRHVPPELSQPPLATVTDIKGTRVELPFATSADNAASCVEAFASGARAGGVGNHQNPYSSYGEDMAALRQFGPEPRAAWSDGHRRVFLEIGAFDGVTESNTILLERCLGWRGVLVEANPRAWTSLKGAGRNHAHLVHAAPMCASQCGLQALVWGVPTKLQNSLSPIPSRFG